MIVYDIFVVREYQSGGEEKKMWTKVGAAFGHKDGQGFNIQLDALPVDGKLVARKQKPRDDHPF